jgi:hypothetical protein
MIERRFFVLAPNFHGATLLARLLNAHPEIVSLADTYPSNHFDQICGCGRHVSQCGFWRKVTDRVGADRYRDHTALLPTYPEIAGPPWDRLLYNLTPQSQLSRLIPADESNLFAADFEKFLHAVNDLQGDSDTRIFVDGVKSMARVRALVAAGVPVDGVVHLWRAPDDFVKSSMKNLGRTWKVFFKSACLWRLFHQQARRLKKIVPYTTVTYEEMTEKPDPTLDRLFRFFEVEPRSVDGLRTEPDRDWHFIGNASLFQFEGSIERSRHHLNPGEKTLIRLIAGSYSQSDRH